MARTRSTRFANPTSLTRPPAGETPARTTRASATTSSESVSADALEDVRLTDADVRSEFRISVRGVAGAPTPTPALQDDWFNAAVSAEARYLASQDVNALIDEAIVGEQNSLGRELEKDEANTIADTLSEQHFRPAFAAHFAVVSKSKASKDKAVKNALAREGAKLSAHARDPFTPIIQNDPVARAKEVVLFENKNAMVIVDTFAPSPKALVIPKKQAMFPGDVSKKELAELADLSRIVSDALSNVTGSAAADIWINPPQRLTVKQLHVHIQPHLPRWEKQRRPRGVPKPPELIAEQNKFYGVLGQEIEKLVKNPPVSPLTARGG